MRVVFFIALIANVGVLAWGQGFFGTPPSELGREPHFLTERNQHAISLQPPLAAPQNP